MSPMDLYLTQHSLSKKAKLPLVITTGEPAGIGMDIVLMLAAQGKLAAFDEPIVVLASMEALIDRYHQLQKNSLSKTNINSLENQLSFKTLTITDINEQNTLSKLDNQSSNPYQLTIADIPIKHRVVAGQLDDNNALMVLTQLQLAHTLAHSGRAAAIVTAPIQKSVIMQLEPDFMGHTEYFMAQSGLDKVVMMLANTMMKVVLVTTHLPLREVADAITQQAVRQTVTIVLAEMQDKFGRTQPKILVCGLNPHAGEAGHLGREEIDIINPVLQSFRDQGVDISLAMPADTLFTAKYVKGCDAIIAMYHDQGLAPLKSHGFGETVNITLGLPYIRTSVDHGTALDLAGTGKASPASLYQALWYASQMYQKSRNDTNDDGV